MGFANGRIPVTFLVHAANGAPGQVLEAQTAEQWAAMVAAAARDGVTLRPQADGGVSSCYRSYDNQVHAKQVQNAGGPTAAYPGTSNHGKGIAIDIVITAQTLAWLNAHAAEYGFDNAQGQATYPPENWHWVRTRVVAGLSTITTTVTQSLTSEDTMILFHQNNSNPPKFALAGSGQGQAAWLEISDQSLANQLAANTPSKTAVNLSPETWQQWASKYLGK